MKKQLLFAALLSTTLLCNSCGTKNNVANDDILPNDASQTNDVLSTNTSETNESDTQTAENNQPASDSGVVIIDSKTVEDQDTADDGTVIYSRSYTQPLVTIANNAEAAEKINADLQSRIDAFTASDSIRKESHEYYEISSKEEGYDFFEYNESLGFEKVRSDTNVISFIMNSSGYMGGAHGFYNSFGLNYDTKTGELIDFAALSDDADKFYKDTLTYNRELTQTDEYKERMFPEDFFDGSELETVLYGDEKWYLSDEGLVFISNPYELGPYASGIIEFVIPYDKLAEMGLKEEYGYK
ncbi:MAG: DUF3298 and DUF4163 domain-containing protein [Lachnospiraceae bacterium]|nr:DUF3298 and DUF4163 domain-containing protein [Lachnospiraceae bacterium]